MKRVILKAIFYIAICLIGALPNACNVKTDSYTVEVKYFESDSSRRITIFNRQEKIVLDFEENGMPGSIGLYEKGDSGYFLGFDNNMNLSLKTENFNGKKHGKENVIYNGFVIEENDFIHGSWVGTERYHYDYDTYYDCIKKAYDSKVLIYDRRIINNNDSLVFIDSSYFPEPEYDFTNYHSTISNTK